MTESQSSSKYSNISGFSEDQSTPAQSAIRDANTPPIISNDTNNNNSNNNENNNHHFYGNGIDNTHVNVNENNNNNDTINNNITEDNDFLEVPEFLSWLPKENARKNVVNQYFDVFGNLGKGGQGTVYCVSFKISAGKDNRKFYALKQIKVLQNCVCVCVCVACVFFFLFLFFFVSFFCFNVFKMLTSLYVLCVCLCVCVCVS